MSLSVAELDSLKLALDGLQQRIQHELRSHRPQNGQVDSGAGDDVVADSLSHDALAQYLHEHHEWQALQRARARLAENISDICSECGGPIPYARLQAEPTAERCVACQSALETKEQRLHLHGHVSL
ncbi:MAG: TraR/DksA family transcriptional regulator [Burkholderiales bacterium]|nr:TraR/DksA family transcriptional regulator [Burkholderiales bacterium]